MTKYVCTTLMAAGLLTMTAVAQDEDTDLDIFSLDDSSAESSSADSSDTASDDSADASDSIAISLGDEEDGSLDESSSEESSDSSLDDSSTDDSGDLALDTDSGSDDGDLGDIGSDDSSDSSDESSDIEEATPVSESGSAVTATTTGSDAQVIANPDKTAWHFISLGDKYVLVKSNLVGHVTPLSTVVIYIGWSADRNSSWGKGETLAKHSRTITSFYVPIRVSSVSISGGNINLHGSDDSGTKTIKAPYRELDNTLEIKRPEL